jgi:DNA-binding MurR/RpiR family transcriptional regulator
MAVLKRITDKYHCFTSSQKIVAEYVIENINTIAFHTLDDLSQEIGVSTTTVIRFARILGYSGYSDMQLDIQKNIKEMVSLPERLDASIKSIHKDSLLLDTFNTDVANLNKTMKNISSAELEKAVNMIAKANNIYILGMRSTFSFAHYMATNLSQVKENVRMIQGTGGVYPEETVSVKKGDVCITCLFPRYQRTIANLISWMKSKGVEIILFTSPSYTDVQHLGDVFLPCWTRGVFVKDSLISLMFLADYIIAAVAAADYDNAKRVITSMEEMLSKGYYLGL